MTCRIYDFPSSGDGMFTLMTHEQLENKVWHHPDSAAIVTGDPRHPPGEGQSLAELETRMYACICVLRLLPNYYAMRSCMCYTQL